MCGVCGGGVLSSCAKLLVLSLQMFKSLKCGFLKGTEIFEEITYF